MAKLKANKQAEAIIQSKVPCEEPGLHHSYLCSFMDSW